jgi:putative CocE/NonD family hydrolase
LRSDAIARFWAARGYAVVVQGTRGRYESGGVFTPLQHEREDGTATLQWLAQQPWYDGHVGMWGGSAFGQTQWAVADQTNPGAEALFIQIASSAILTAQDVSRAIIIIDAIAAEQSIVAAAAFEYVGAV